MVEAEVEAVPPVVRVVLDGPLEKAIGLENLRPRMGHPDRRETIGVADVRIQRRHHVDEAAEMLRQPLVDRGLCPSDLYGPKPVVVRQKRVEPEARGSHGRRRGTKSAPRSARVSVGTRACAQPVRNTKPTRARI